MKKLKTLKYGIIAAGIFISVAFYFLSGPGTEIRQAASESESVWETAGELQFSDTQILQLEECVRRSVREELSAICEEGYLTEALAAGTKAAAEQEALHAGMVNLNTAEKAELMQLEGIGEKRAEDIISYREQNGCFRNIEEIMRVKGIKESAFARIREKIYV